MLASLLLADSRGAPTSQDRAAARGDGDTPMAAIQHQASHILLGHVRELLGEDILQADQPVHQAVSVSSTTTPAGTDGLL